MINSMKYIRNWFIKTIYGNQNSSRVVSRTVARLLDELNEDSVGLNVGSGPTDLDRRVKRMEIEHGDGIDYVGIAESIPEVDNTFDLVISQEVLEHVKRPDIAMLEMKRVLKRHGKCYIQVPFIIGFHPCPADYWRYTKEGITALVENSGLEIIELGETVGSATGFYRIGVEFCSILFSILVPRSYILAKAFFAVALYPIKWLDPLLRLSKEGERISGGYYVVCTKK